MLNLDISQIIIQIIAFLLMLWVMKRFGWQPLLDALEARKKKIQSEFDSLAAQKEEVKDLAMQYQDKLSDIEAEARKRIQESVEEGQRITREMQEEAQTTAKEILNRAKQEMGREIDEAKSQLKNDMANLVVRTTEKILQEKLDPEAQKKLISKFVEEAHYK